jgi:flagellar protein FlaG
MLLRQLDAMTPPAAQATEGVGASAPSPTAMGPPPARPAESADPSTPAGSEDVKRAVDSANVSIAQAAPSLEFQFEVEPDTKILVVRLLDRNDKSVLRQIPAEEMIAIARALNRMQSLLINSKA